MVIAENAAKPTTAPTPAAARTAHGRPSVTATPYAAAPTRQQKRPSRNSRDACVLWLWPSPMETALAAQEAAPAIAAYFAISNGFMPPRSSAPAGESSLSRVMPDELRALYAE